MLRANQLDVNRAFVLVIDLQETLLPAIRHGKHVIQAAKKLLDAVPEPKGAEYA